MSSQDTSIVSRFYGPLATSEAPGKPMPHPPALGHVPSKRLHPGTFVPSADHLPDGVAEVRQALFGPDHHLYVADRRANAIKQYDGASGGLLHAIKAGDLENPIHLLFDHTGHRLYVGSEARDSVLAYDLTTDRVFTFIAPRSGGLREPAGMALGDDGYLYVASRGTRQILRYDAVNGRPDAKPFIDDMRDRPEFLLLVDAGDGDTRRSL